MRYNDFKLTEEEILEVKMSPGSLSNMVKGINAIAGIEFEMYVPNVQAGDSDEMEEDYSHDPVPQSIDDIIEFFDDGDYNYDLSSVRTELEENYREWLYNECADDFSNEYDLETLSDEFEEWLRSEYDEDTDEEIEEKIQAARRNPNNYDRRAFLEKYRDENFEDYEQDYIDSHWFDYQRDWLRNEGIREMSDVPRGYDVRWIYWTSNAENTIEDVANDFNDVVDSPVKWGSSYHSVHRDEKSYIIEPDSSLTDTEDPVDGGLEFVSPPLPLNKLLDDTKNIIDWAKSYGCYTNASCGLHMNVSIEGVDNSQLDYVKLALFVGESYVLQQFERVGNTYAKSVLDTLSRAVKVNAVDAVNVLDKMRSQLNNVAYKVIHTGITNHFDGLNVHDKYVEFRYAGNDWLDMDFEKLANTLRRYIVAYNIACDPNAYKEEYAKKLYKLISPSDDKIHTLKYFADYSSGKIPRSALVSFIKNSQQQRQRVQQGITNNRYIVKIKPRYFWIYGEYLPNGAMVVAVDENEAIEKIKQRFAISEVPNDGFSVELKAQHVS